MEVDVGDPSAKVPAITGRAGRAVGEIDGQWTATGGYRWRNGMTGGCGDSDGLRRGHRATAGVRDSQRYRIVSG